eukprot:5691043-Amphidinium_carterae.1
MQPCRGLASDHLEIAHCLGFRPKLVTREVSLRCDPQHVLICIARLWLLVLPVLGHSAVQALQPEVNPGANEEARLLSLCVTSAIHTCQRL